MCKLDFSNGATGWQLMNWGRCTAAIGTDEDIPIYNRDGERLFWISVKAVSDSMTDDASASIASLNKS